MLRQVMLSVGVVTLLPLIIMTGINYYQYQRALTSESRQPISRLTSNSKRAVESFLHERESALRFIVHNRSITPDCNNDQLRRVLKNLRKSLTVGAFVDLGVIDAAGYQKCYHGPFNLLHKNYQNQDWFHQVNRRGIYISDVFLGFRRSPHFVIAIRHEATDGNEFILRATIDSEQLNDRLQTTGLRPSSDVFIINRKGILQSPSRRYGKVLSRCPLPVPQYSDRTEVVERVDDKGRKIFVGYAYIKHSSFVLMMIKRYDEVMGGWFTLRMELIGFLLLSCVLILVVIYWGSRKMVHSIRNADLARAQVFHKMEYTNKLASIGRLAAGVAHEINNPLAIINEKAGLLKDRISLSKEPIPMEERLLQSINSILKSVNRCSAVTHRLLGFAKHMDVRFETIDLYQLLKEVLGFLDKEAAYRDINVAFDLREDLPNIKSDRGQLQQVFLNIINNAFAAVSDSGQIEITLLRVGADTVAVRIKDDGVGIPKENLERIFEPFFTTKPGVGTGLGLSVTYGIIQKLGGTLRVQSEHGKGTLFTVELPINADA
ncbi:MAG: ATP-binding protein [bacterium]